MRTSNRSTADPAATPASLLATATEAMNRALERPPVKRADPSAQIITEMMDRNLEKDEIQILASITALRERGLTVCRAGQLHQAGYIMARARDMLVQANLSDEAFALADSSQCAAEGFVQFKMIESDRAISSMFSAIGRCGELWDTWGYPAESRRIHLACNAMRVRVEISDGEESATTLAQLLNLIRISNRRFWPYPELEYASKPDRLDDDDDRKELMDQVLAVARRLKPGALDSIVAAFPDAPTGTMNPLSAQAECFVRALQAHSSGDTETFLSCCIEFFPTGAQSLPRAFQYLTEQLRKCL